MITPKEIKTLILSDEKTFYRLLLQVTDRVLKEHQAFQEESWISEKECMSLLQIKSKTTLSTYRAKNYIAYSALGPRSFIYRKSSVIAFIKSREIPSTL